MNIVGTVEIILGAKIGGKKLDVFVLIILFAGGVLYAYLAKDFYIGKFLFVTVVAMLPPIIYLSLRKKKNWV